MESSSKASLSALRDKLDFSNAFAQLLAKEGIRVNIAPVSTAFFDLKARSLTLPAWDNVSKELRCLLLGHEVGHALNSTVPNHYKFKKICKDLGISFAAYRILEDVRVDNNQKRLYPGLKRDYFIGAKDLIDRDFFGANIKGRINKKCLMDRINVHFKAGHVVPVTFKAKEQNLLDLLNRLYTVEELEEALKMIAKMEKDNPSTDQHQDMEEQSGEGQGDGEEPDEDSKRSKKSKKNKNSKKDKSNGKDTDDQNSDGSGDDEADESDKTGAADESADEGEEADENSDGSGSGDEDADEAIEDADGNSEGNEPKDKSDESDQDGDQDGKKSDADPTKPTTMQPNESRADKHEHDDDDCSSCGNHVIGNDGYDTQKAFGDALKQLTQTSIDNQFSLPLFNLDKVILPYKQYYSLFHKDDVQLPVGVPHGRFEDRFNKFFADMERVSQLFQAEFERRKRATSYRKARETTSGDINLSALHQYKFKEDIFQRVLEIPEGKNHGLVFLLDYSGSMNTPLLSVVEQMLILANFCRKSGIKFSCFNYTDFQGAQGYEYDQNSKTWGSAGILKTAVEEGDLIMDSGVRLVQMLSSDMTHNEFNRCARLLWIVSFFHSCYFEAFERDYAINATVPSKIRDFHNRLSRYNYHNVAPVAGQTQYEAAMRSFSSVHCMNGTPTGEALFVMSQFLPEFKARNRLEKINMVVLTDGDANPINNKHSYKSYYQNAEKYWTSTPVGSSHRWGQSNTLKCYDKLTRAWYTLPGYSFANPVWASEFMYSVVRERLNFPINIVQIYATSHIKSASSLLERASIWKNRDQLTDDDKYEDFGSLAARQSANAATDIVPLRQKFNQTGWTDFVYPGLDRYFVMKVDKDRSVEDAKAAADALGKIADAAKLGKVLASSVTAALKDQVRSTVGRYSKIVATFVDLIA